MDYAEKVEVVTFEKSWLIRIGAALVLVTTVLLILLSIAAFLLHFTGPFAALALCSYLVGSIGMILLCLGSIRVLMRRRRID